MDDENDVLCLKLINGKRTYVHRRYWNLISNLVQSNRCPYRKPKTANRPPRIG